MEVTIESIEVRTFRTVAWTAQDSEGHRHPSGERPAEAAVVTVRDADGAEGHCLGNAAALREPVLDAFFRKALTGQGAFMREMLWQRLYRMQRGSGGQLTDRAIGYVDQALRDLAGRKLGLPVWKLLVGARDRLVHEAAGQALDARHLAEPRQPGPAGNRLPDQRAVPLRLQLQRPAQPGRDPAGTRGCSWRSPPCARSVSAIHVCKPLLLS